MTTLPVARPHRPASRGRAASAMPARTWPPPRRSLGTRPPARARNRRCWLLSTLHAHTKAPYKTNFLKKTLRPLQRPGRARTDAREGHPHPPCGRDRAPNVQVQPRARSGRVISTPPGFSYGESQMAIWHIPGAHANDRTAHGWALPLVVVGHEDHSRGAADPEDAAEQADAHAAEHRPAEIRPVPQVQPGLG
jgi:hypothetical protein